MKKIFLIATLVAVAVVLNPLQASADNRAKNRQEVINRNYGFYKDILMDSGVGLSSRRTLPAASSLGLEMEYFKSFIYCLIAYIGNVLIIAIILFVFGR